MNFVAIKCQVSRPMPIDHDWNQFKSKTQTPLLRCRGLCCNAYVAR